MKYYIIKREDTSPQPCCYYKAKSEWAGNWEKAQRFDDAIDAEYTRKHLNTGDTKRRSFVCEVELVEKEVVVQTTAITTRQEGPGFTKREPLRT